MAVCRSSPARRSSIVRASSVRHTWMRSTLRGMRVTSVSIARQRRTPRSLTVEVLTAAARYCAKSPSCSDKERAVRISSRMAHSCDLQELLSAAPIDESSCSNSTVRSSSVNELASRATRATRLESKRSLIVAGESCGVSAAAAGCCTGGRPNAAAMSLADRETFTTGAKGEGERTVAAVPSNIGHSRSISHGTQLHPCEQHVASVDARVTFVIAASARRSQPRGTLLRLLRATAKAPIGEKEVNSTSVKKSRPLLSSS